MGHRCSALLCSGHLIETKLDFSTRYEVLFLGEIIFRENFFYKVVIPDILAGQKTIKGSFYPSFFPGRIL